jgi:hypothetical protein
LPELRAELLASGLVTDISTTTLWRWLAEDPIKPWQHQSWILPHDPDFAAKAGVVLDLHQRVFQAAELGTDEYVISADEKTSIQARCRRRSDWRKRSNVAAVCSWRRGTVSGAGAWPASSLSWPCRGRRAS